jgi:AsnC-type helix-turn-helix domain
VRTSVVLVLLLTANDWDPDSPELSPWRLRVSKGLPPPAATDIDDLDRGIEQLLRQDARMPSVRMAKALHVSEATLHRRLQRLLSSEMLVLRAVVSDAARLPRGDPFRPGDPTPTPGR